ncbi:MAG: hypothetical protein IJJ93_00470 [Acidaminococcaceae bacterium]|nr:hypothetical protein [Acidaminococcaceae bacterium]
MRRELSFYFDTVLNFSGSVTEHNFLLRCIPADKPEQSILSYTLTVYPDGAASLGRDSFGNVVRALKPWKAKANAASTSSTWALSPMRSSR